MALAGLAASGLAGAGFLFTRSARFGALPDGVLQDRCAASPRYWDGVFHNLQPTPLMRGGKSPLGAWWEFLTTHPARVRPAHPLPAASVRLASLPLDRDAFVWLGHSSFFLILGGQRVLLDPVLGRYAAPLPVAVRAFAGTVTVQPQDLPVIDLLVISHDHWDHLDYPTLHALEPRIRRVACPLGVDAHLERFGFAREKLWAADWGDILDCGSLTVHATPARHFSGRLFTRDKSLWAGFWIDSARHRVFFSGDSGYGPHFRTIGRRFGPPDLALIDMGQYNSQWPHVHMTPEEAAQAADDLRARTLAPAHVGKFCLSRHPWDEPFKRMAAAARERPWAFLTPRIGEPVALEAPGLFAHWWEGVD